MLCDILVASPTAVFGQPEITLGIIPGMGGSQRLTSLIGKARAMDMVLTGRKIDAETAERWGLVSRVTKEGESVTEEAVKVAESVSKFGKVAVQAGKEAVNGCKFDTRAGDVCIRILTFCVALDLPLEQGLRLERRLFQQLFATKDQKEGELSFRLFSPTV